MNKKLNPEQMEKISGGVGDTGGISELKRYCAIVYVEPGDTPDSIANHILNRHHVVPNEYYVKRIAPVIQSKLTRDPQYNCICYEIEIESPINELHKFKVTG